MAFVVKCERCGNIQEKIVRDEDRFPYDIIDLHEKSKRGMMLHDPLDDRTHVHLCDHCQHAFLAFLNNWPLEAEPMIDKVVQDKIDADEDFRKKSVECAELVKDNKRLLKTKEDLENDIRILKKRLAEAKNE
jgi:hypothetical protein